MHNCACVHTVGESFIACNVDVSHANLLHGGTSLISRALSVGNRRRIPFLQAVKLRDETWLKHNRAARTRVPRGRARAREPRSRAPGILAHAAQIRTQMSIASRATGARIVGHHLVQLWRNPRFEFHHTAGHPRTARTRSPCTLPHLPHS